MELEKSIKQSKPYENVYERAMVNILHSYGWLAHKQKSFFNKYDLTVKQYNILRILRGAKEPLSTSEIRDRMVDKMSDTTRLIERMLKKNWVVKEVNEVDRRLVDVILSEKGRALVNDLDNSISEMNEFLSALSEEEARQLNQLLDKMRGD